MHTPRCAPSAQRCRPSRGGAATPERQPVRHNGPIIVCLAAALGVSGFVPRAAAQERELKTYGPSASEAKLMLYYSSTMAFSPIGVPYGAKQPSAIATATGRTAPRIELGLEFSYLPTLSSDQRTIGTDKPEATNLAPMFARPRVGVRLPNGFGLEASWIPPVRVFDVKANVFAAALSRAFVVGSGVRLTPRLSVLGGRVEGPITCNRDTAYNSGDDALVTYYTFVCHNNNSRDFFDPRHIAGELIVARPLANGRWEPYLSAGARAEKTRFDVGVIRPDGSRDQDNPVLEVKTTRPYGAAGTSWVGVPRTRLAAEVYYAPGSVLTVRALAGVYVW